MNNSKWSELKYLNPTDLLVELDKLFASSGILKYKNPADILLKRQVRDISEDRRCAIFCHGAGQALNKKILFAPFGKIDDDIDYIGAYAHQGSIHRFPIQLKQLVPDRFPAATNLQSEITKLKKYSETSDLVVAFHINRKINFRPQDLDLSGLKLKELWLFGLQQENTWLLFGNLMASSPNAYTFQLPVV